MKTILIANRKGGVGKTTTAINLSCVIAKEYRVLLIDLDTQSHLQYGFGFKKRFAKGIHQSLKEKSLDGAICHSGFENLDFIPADINFDVSALPNEKSRLLKLLKEDDIDKKYDFCIIDTPPTSDILIFNALIASDYLLVPMQTEYLGLVGVLQFLKMFYENASKLRTNFKFLGVVPTLYNPSIKEH